MRHWCERNGPIDGTCDRCRKVYDSVSSLCWHCGREVTNGAFFKASSPHLNGTCKPEKPWPDKIPEPRWKTKLPYPMPAMPDYNNGMYPKTIEAFRAWWNLPAIGEKKK